MKKMVSVMLRASYIVTIVAWLILACVLRIAETKGGIVVLDVVGLVGFGSWILQNYIDCGWD